MTEQHNDQTSDMKSEPAAGLRFWRVARVLVLLGLVALVGGFMVFVHHVDRLQFAETSKADGIVVVTGGVQRIDAGIRLLRDGQADQMLISGVHPRTRPRDLVSRQQADDALMNCCIALDFRATNTVGNAVETRVWARANGMNSIILVTNAYHVPRSKLEFEARMPDVEIHAYPVRYSEAEGRIWWTRPEAVRVLFVEYLKFMVARLRLAMHEPRNSV